MHEEDAVVRTRRKTPDVAEVEILGDEESRFVLRCLPYHIIVRRNEGFISHGMNVVPQCGEDSLEPVGDVLV